MQPNHVHIVPIWLRTRVVLVPQIRGAHDQDHDLAHDWRLRKAAAVVADSHGLDPVGQRTVAVDDLPKDHSLQLLVGGHTLKNVTVQEDPSMSTPRHTRISVSYSLFVRRLGSIEFVVHFSQFGCSAGCAGTSAIQCQ